MSHGHSWASIQEYSLSEIGAFLSVIVKKEATDRADALSTNWMATHLSYEGLTNTLDRMNKKVPGAKKKKKDPGPDPKEIQANWNKLRMKMSRLK